MDESYLHRMDVTAKIICFFCVVIMVFLFNHPLPNLLIAAALLAAVLPARLRMKSVFGALKALVPIILLIIAITCFTAVPKNFCLPSSSRVLFTLFGAKATLGGLLQGLTFMLRIFIMVFATSVFTICTPVDALLGFFNKIRASYTLSIVVATAISFVPTMMQKKEMIFQAQRARGAGVGGKGIFGQLRAYVPIMIPLVTNSILMADHLSIAMTNRGYGANRGWTNLTETKMRPSDYLVSAGAIALTIGCILIRFVLRIGMI